MSGLLPPLGERIWIWTGCFAFAAVVQVGLAMALSPPEARHFVTREDLLPPSAPLFVKVRVPRASAEVAHAAAPALSLPLSTTPKSKEPAPAQPNPVAATNAPRTPRREVEAKKPAPRRAKTSTTRSPPNVARSPSTSSSLGGDANNANDEGPAHQDQSQPQSPAFATASGHRDSDPRQAEPYPPPSRPSATPDQLRAWAATLGPIVQRGLRYPPTAERDGLEGVAILRLTLASDGRLLSVTLHRSSGDTRLDDAALARVRTVGVFPPPPAPPDGGARTVDLPVRFELDD